jgi:nitroreductase/dihydropteridine reductase
MQLLEKLKWRYATKKYDTSQKVSPHHIDYIKEAVQLAASSYGLQPYKLLDITDPTIREALKPISWNQSQVTDASHLFVFCNYAVVNDEAIDEFIRLKVEVSGLSLDTYNGYGDFVKSKLKEKTATDMANWTAKQTYIALANALNACADLHIDSTPIEGFDAEAYDTILHLSEQGLHACVVLAIGYRHPEDVAQHAKKVRKPAAMLFEER